ncbi:MAG: glycosyltransferase family protein [Pikeienuella sp.]
MKVMLVVTSLMGAGHLNRTLIIARALKNAGASPVVVSGGRALPQLDTEGIEVIQLPPLSADGIDYSRLLTADGVADEAYFAARKHALLAAYNDARPDALVTELFPFGRRNLSDEFTVLLDHAKGKSRIWASIRDVLEPKKKPKRIAETVDRLNRWFDGVLVHGDPSVIGLAASWPGVSDVQQKIHYTGYVAAPNPKPMPSAEGEILVAVGGGVIGRKMLETAVEASNGSDRVWRLRTGGADAAQQAERLQKMVASPLVIVEPAAFDYRARLASAACSVSLFGYNTATDLIAAGTPAVIVPMDEGGEQEQIIRAEAFSGLPGFTMLRDPDAATLRNAVDTAIDGPRPSPNLGMDGAVQAADLIIHAGGL